MVRSELRGRPALAAASPLLVAALLTGMTTACAEEASELRGRADWPTGLAAVVDSGNAAYRAGDYREARRHFRAAARGAPDVGTAWFGVYMAERALGNQAAADSALRWVGELGDAARFHHGTPVRGDGEADGRPAGAAGPEEGPASEGSASLRHRDPCSEDGTDG